MDYIEQHLSDKITGRQLAGVIDISVGQLFRAFKASMGVPPFHYITSRRIEFACTLIETTNEPLSQIALASGLCDQAHLCRVFRRKMGITPAAWRHANGNGPRVVYPAHSQNAAAASCGLQHRKAPGAPSFSLNPPPPRPRRAPRAAAPESTAVSAARTATPTSRRGRARTADSSGKRVPASWRPRPPGW